MARARATAVLARNELRYLVALPGPALAYLLMPIVMIAFVSRSFQVVVNQFGYPSAQGGELAVPAMATMFGFLVAAHYGLFFFNEHQWGIWQRLRGSAVGGSQILAAKGSVLAAHEVVQFVLLVVAVGPFVGLVPRPRYWSLLVVIVATVAMITAFAGLAAIVSPTQAVYDGICYGGGILLTALGGGIAPYWLLPTWVQRVAPASPVYWTLRGFRVVVLDDRSIGAVVPSVGVLLAFAAGFALVGRATYRPTARKSARIR